MAQFDKKKLSIIDSPFLETSVAERQSVLGSSSVVDELDNLKNMSSIARGYTCLDWLTGANRVLSMQDSQDIFRLNSFSVFENGGLSSTKIDGFLGDNIRLSVLATSLVPQNRSLLMSPSVNLGEIDTEAESVYFMEDELIMRLGPGHEFATVDSDSFTIKEIQERGDVVTLVSAGYGHSSTISYLPFEPSETSPIKGLLKGPNGTCFVAEGLSVGQERVLVRAVAFPHSKFIVGVADALLAWCARPLNPLLPNGESWNTRRLEAASYETVIKGFTP